MAGREALVGRFIRAMYDQDADFLRENMNPDFLSDLPQSGERSRGFEQFWAQLVAYPGGGPAPDEELPEFRVVGDDERWALTPGYSIVPLANANEFTIVGSTRYPDGVLWHMIMSIELRDEKLYRMVSFFAPEMPAPALANVGRASEAR